jgi:subtilisin family serine protease
MRPIPFPNAPRAESYEIGGVVNWAIADRGRAPIALRRRATMTRPLALLMFFHLMSFPVATTHGQSVPTAPDGRGKGVSSSGSAPRLHPSKAIPAPSPGAGEGRAPEGPRPGDARLDVSDVRPLAVHEQLAPMGTTNAAAKIIHHASHFIAAFPGKLDDGRAVTIAIFDDGAVRETHKEFKDDRGVKRVQKITNRPFNEHATQVAGTLAAWGFDPRAEGMAKRARLQSYAFREVDRDRDHDLEQLERIAGQVQVSNHSYGEPRGWFTKDKINWFWYGDPTSSEDPRFGKYSDRSARLDKILYEHDTLLTFVAAGNDRDEPTTSKPQPFRHRELSEKDLRTGERVWQVVEDKVRKPDGFDRGGIDTLNDLSVAKNAICVGAIHRELDDDAPIQMIAYSSWGPTDDGRIKPDLVAMGQAVLTTSSADDEAYLEISGTSVATPVAAGAGSLLIEYFYLKNEKKRLPTSTEIKALLIHTADDFDAIRGPDVRTGWGLINTLRAGRVIEGKDGQFIRSEAVSAGNKPWKRPLLRVPEQSDKIRVTIAWLDPPAPASSDKLDDTTPTLQNDLDLELVGPDGAVHYPYSLDRRDPLAQATRSGPNTVDNVEVIDIDSPPQRGTWLVRVKADKLKPRVTQTFALVVSGLVEAEGD